MPEVSGGSAGPLFQEAPSRTGYIEYIEELEKRAFQDPDDEAIWREFGNAYFDRDQYPEAIDAYRRSLEIDPGNANVWTDMGIMYRKCPASTAVSCYSTISTTGLKRFSPGMSWSN